MSKTSDIYEEIFDEIIKEIEPAIPLKLVNNIELILASSTREGFGTVIVSGIESAGYAFDKHKHFFKCGGWSHLFCDGVSAYAIGMQALKCALMSGDSFIEKTSLEKKSPIISA